MIDTDIKEALVVCLSRHGDSPESGIAAAEVLLGIAIGLARKYRGPADTAATLYREAYRLAVETAQ